MTHPAQDIKGARSSVLLGKKIVLGITGSIAAVECVHLARELARARDDGAGSVGADDGVAGGVDHGPVAFLALAQRPFGPHFPRPISAHIARSTRSCA